MGLGLAGCIDEAGGAAVEALALLVALGDEEHGDAVEGGAAGGTDADADGGAFDGRGVVGAVAEGGAGVDDGGRGRAGRVVVGAGVGAAELAAGVDGEGGVDHGHEGFDGGVRVLVEVGVGGADGDGEGVDGVGGDEGHGEGGDVAERVDCGVGLEHFHRHFAYVDAEAVGDALREVLEDLLDGKLVLDDELVVEGIEEGDLDKGCAWRCSRYVAVWSLDTVR